MRDAWKKMRVVTTLKGFTGNVDRNERAKTTNNTDNRREQERKTKKRVRWGGVEIIPDRARRRESNNGPV
jgi:hypothetical protein